MALAASAASCGIFGAVADLQQVGVGRPRHGQALERHRSFQAARGAVGGRLVLGLTQAEAVVHRAQHRIRADQLDLRGQELVGVVERGAGGIVAHDSRRRLTVDVDRGGRLVDRRQPRRDDPGGRDGCQHEAGDAEAVALQDPEVLRKRDLGGFRLVVPVWVLVPGRSGVGRQLAELNHGGDVFVRDHTHKT